MTFIKKVQRKVLILGSIMIVCGLIFSGLGILVFFEPVTPPALLNTMSQSEVSAGDSVALKTLAYVGVYATESEGSTDYDYLLIGTKDSADKVYFLTLRLKADDSDALYAYISAHPDDSWTTTQSFYGDLVTLNKDAKSYLDAALEEYPINENYTVLNLVLEGKPGVYTPNDAENQIFGIIFTILGLGLIAYIIYELVWHGKKEVLKVASSLALDGDGVAYMERFDLSAEKISDAYVSDEAILSNINFRVKLIPLKDILWAYRLDMNLASKRVNPSASEPRFLKVLHSFLVVLRTPDKKRYNLALRSYDQAVDLVERIKRQNPNLATISFDPQLEKAFKKDPLGFKAKADYIQEHLNKPQQ